MAEAHPDLAVRDYTLTPLATGLTALNIRELRERVESVPPASLLHHFWGRLLRFGEQEGVYGNDLAEWAGAALHDPVLAERLALIDPMRSGDLHELRGRVLDVVDQRLEELEGRPVEASPEHPFYFVADQMVIYDTGLRVPDPGALLAQLQEWSDESVFLHFVSPPGLEGVEDLSAPGWLRAFGDGAAAAARELEGMDVFLLRSGELRGRIRTILESHLEAA